MSKSTPQHRRPFNLSDLEDLVERLVFLAFRVSGAVVVCAWLFQHIRQELRF